MIGGKLNGTDCVCRAEIGIGGRKRGIPRDHLLEKLDTFDDARNALLERQRTCPKVKVVSVDVGFVVASAATEFQPQVIDDAPSNLILDSEDILQLPLKPAGPQRKVVTHTNQLRVDPQLLAVAQYGTFENVVGSELLSRFTQIPWLPLQRKRRGPRADRQPVDGC